MLDIFIVCFNRQEFDLFIQNAYEQLGTEIKRKQVHYVNGPEVLRGVHGARVFLFGNYFKRTDWFTIERLIEEQGNRRLLIR